ncbi:MAG: hypothetical protein ABIH99_04685 [Candidatus Micrarchaeota archaeon]
MVDYCFVCKREKAGRELELDFIMRTLIRVRRKLGILRSEGKMLVVCEECLPTYEKNLEAFSKKVATYGVIGVFVALAEVILAHNLLAGAILGLFILALSFLSYVPALKEKKK